MAALVCEALEEYGVHTEPMGLDVGNAGLITAFEDNNVDVRTNECVDLLHDARKVKTRDEIEEGMTMAVETMEPADRQGVRVEEMVVVRENGVEILSQWPVEEITQIDY